MFTEERTLDFIGLKEVVNMSALTSTSMHECESLSNVSQDEEKSESNILKD